MAVGKSLVSGVCLALSLSAIGWTAEKSEKQAAPPPSVKPRLHRSLPFDLKQVKGLSDTKLSQEAKARLAENGFVVVGRPGGDIAACYDWSNEVPPFVTLDSVLEIFLADFEIAWGELEEKQGQSFAALQKELWDALTRRFEKLQTEAAKRAGTRLLGLIAVACSLADSEFRIPEKLPTGVDAEALRQAWKTDLGNVMRGEGTGRSALWQREIDWSVFRPVGPYEANEQRKRFYRLSQWWGFQGFRATDREERLCAGILVWVLQDASKSRDELWSPEETYDYRYGDPMDGLLGRLQRMEMIYDRFFAQPADVSPWQLLFNEDELKKVSVRAMFGSYECDKWIQDKFARCEFPEAYRDWDLAERFSAGSLGQNMRLLPPRMTPDARVFAQMIEPNLGSPPLGWRLLPRGLDMLAAYGNDRAKELTLSAETKPAERDLLAKQIMKIRGLIAKEEGEGDSGGLRDVQGSLRRMLCSQASPWPDERSPLFTCTSAYRDRCLASALATWAGIREIYSPRVAIFGGSGSAVKPLPGLADPNLDGWQRLIEFWYACHTAFEKAGVKLSPKSLEWALRYRRIAEKQLRGEPLNAEELYAFVKYGVALANAIEIHPPTPHASTSGLELDRRVAVSFARSRIPDLVRFAGKACSRCYAIVEYGGQLQLCQGGVFEYVEFDRPPGKALPRADFQKLMDSPDAPPLPDWTGSYRAKP